jgi:co-chaperonin GroES (HSP10)
MRALNDFLIIDPIAEEIKSASGMFMGEKEKNDLRYLKGKVLAVSPLLGDELKVGDEILYDKVRAYEARIDGTMHTIIRKIDAVIVL